MSLQDAYAVASELDPAAGQIILALSKGAEGGARYSPVLEGPTPVPVTIWGACPAETEIIGSVRNAEVSFRNLRIEIEARSASISAHEAWLDMILEESTLNADTALVELVTVTPDSTAELRRCAESTTETGYCHRFVIQSGGAMTLEDSALSSWTQNGRPYFHTTMKTFHPTLASGKESEVTIRRSFACLGCLELAGSAAVLDSRIALGKPSECPPLDPTDICFTPTAQPGIAFDSSPTVAVIERVVIDEPRIAGILATSASLSLEDVAVRSAMGDVLVFASDPIQAGESSPDECEAHFGRGLMAQQGGTITGSRVYLHETRDVGLFAAEEGSRVQMQDLTVSRVADQRCTTPELFADDFCLMPTCQWNATSGLVVREGGSIHLDRFSIQDSALAGVLVGVGGDVYLENGEIKGNRIGASVQDEDFDLARLQNNVVWTDNEVEVDSTEVTAPEKLREWACNNGQDDDYDELIDCDDDDCAAFAECI